VLRAKGVDINLTNAVRSVHLDVEVNNKLSITRTCIYGGTTDVLSARLSGHLLVRRPSHALEGRIALHSPSVGLTCLVAFAKV